MITKRHLKGDVASEAVYSDCGRYRYALTRIWEEAGKRLLFIMLNPSKATELKNDPTVERCERRARVLGYGGFRVVNIFAWRETDPTKLRRAAEPVGPENDAQILAGCAWADDILCGWGAHGAHLDRGAAVAALLNGEARKLSCLGETRQGHPRHPLYIAYASQPVRWTPELHLQTE